MNRILSRALVVVLLALGTTAVLWAKGATVKLAVTGPNLPLGVEVTDPSAMANVWGSAGGCASPHSFYGRLAPTPAPDLPRYRVAFHVRPTGDETVRVMYVVGFVVDPATSKAFVYFPARGEDGYAVNSGSIVREANEGKWYEADGAWSAAINAKLAPALARR